MVWASSMPLHCLQSCFMQHKSMGKEEDRCFSLAVEWGINCKWPLSPSSRQDPGTRPGRASVPHLTARGCPGMTTESGQAKKHPCKVSCTPAETPENAPDPSA